jgi:hypothetical protein
MPATEGLDKWRGCVFCDEEIVGQAEGFVLNRSAVASAL